MKIEENFVIDTNILIYSLDKSSEFFDFSKNIIKQNRDRVFVTSKSISEFVSVLSKISAYNIIDKELQNLLNDFSILYPDTNSMKIFQRLIMKYKPKGNRVYDFEIISIMQAYGIKSIASINEYDFKNVKEINIIKRLTSSSADS